MGINNFHIFVKVMKINPERKIIVYHEGSDNHHVLSVRLILTSI